MALATALIVCFQRHLYLHVTPRANGFVTTIWIVFQFFIAPTLFISFFAVSYQKTGYGAWPHQMRSPHQSTEVIVPSIVTTVLLCVAFELLSAFMADENSVGADEILTKTALIIVVTGGSMWGIIAAARHLTQPRSSLPTMPLTLPVMFAGCMVGLIIGLMVPGNWLLDQPPELRHRYGSYFRPTSPDHWPTIPMDYSERFGALEVLRIPTVQVDIDSFYKSTRESSYPYRAINDSGRDFGRPRIMQGGPDSDVVIVEMERDMGHGVYRRWLKEDD